VLRKFSQSHGDGERSFLLNFHKHVGGLK
jgi:hypothetical protein